MQHLKPMNCTYPFDIRTHIWCHSCFSHIFCKFYFLLDLALHWAKSFLLPVPCVCVCSSYLVYIGIHCQLWGVERLLNVILLCRALLCCAVLCAQLLYTNAYFWYSTSESCERQTDMSSCLVHHLSTLCAQNTHIGHKPISSRGGEHFFFFIGYRLNYSYYGNNNLLCITLICRWSKHNKMSSYFLHFLINKFVHMSNWNFGLEWLSLDRMNREPYMCH